MQKTLKTKIEKELKKAGGIWGVYIKDLTTDKIIYEHNANEWFPSASIGKVPIALYVFSEIDNKRVSLEDEITLEQELKLGGSGVLKYLHAGMKLTIQDVLTLMLVVSDNTCAKLLVKKFTPQRINGYLTKRGFETTKLKIDGDKFGYGLTTPQEIARMFEGIYKNEYFSKENSDLFLELLKKQHTAERMVRYLPEKIDNETELRVANKSGSIPGVRSDAGIVLAKSPYSIAVLSKDITDDSYRPDNLGVLTIAKVSKIVYDFLN